MARGEDPQWYKDAVLYELHVKTFFDSDSDGIGDFQGLLQKLDYLQDLGVTALWLLPFYPSPLRDDGYDISDYTAVHPAYGQLADFKAVLREAHRRGLRVITELVLNHSSNEHPWFQRARRAPKGSAWRDWYVWSDDPQRYEQARIIFKDFETSNWTWDPVAEQYFWHRFYSHQPDLNYDNPRVKRAMLQVVDFWLGLGVDGLRLDAVPYLFERDGTTCENLAEGHAFLRELRHHIDQRWPARMLLAEANQWPEDAAAYFGKGDECHMAFHFPVMPRMFMGVRLEDRFPIVDILEQTPPIPDSCQWALFLRNHDELTLEMVTDEDRDYMYRVYASDPQARINLGIRRRLAPLLKNRRKIELLNGLLFSLPGTPVLYYADEIGMGENIYLGDRNGVRTPMHWSGDRNAGFSRCNPQKLYLPVIIDPEYHYEAINVEAQQHNPHSLLWWTKRLVALRKRYKAFGRGTLEVLHPDNRKVLAFIRAHGDERILVVANLSRFVQYVELDLRALHGTTPVELFGRTRFPAIGEQPYFLTLGPHAFYWFLLEAPRAEPLELRLPPLEVEGHWTAVLEDPAALEERLTHWLPSQRWFAGKARSLKSVAVRGALALTRSGPRIAMLEVQYHEDEADSYSLPLAFAAGERGEVVRHEHPSAVIATLHAHGGRDGVLFDASVDPELCAGLLELLARRRTLRGEDGLALAPVDARRFADLRGDAPLPPPSPSRAEQSNTSVLFGERFVMKLVRRLEPGENPELEVGRALADKAAPVAPFAGALELRRGREPPTTLAVVLGFVANEGDAWRWTLDSLGRSFEWALTHPERLPEVGHPALLVPDAEPEPLPEPLAKGLDAYPAMIQLLGQRTAELHTALAHAHEPGFDSEPFGPLYQRSVYESIRARVAHLMDLLRRRLKHLPEAAHADARKVLEARGSIAKGLRALLDAKLTGLRLRCHGDLHLGQVLYTGGDFVVIDFEGEPARPIGERRIKRSPLRDVAGMVRSFHYAACASLRSQPVRPEDSEQLAAWAHRWYRWISHLYVASYLTAGAAGHYLPETRAEVRLLLQAYLLEKAAYEVEYELNHRPSWVGIPLEGLAELVG